MAIEYANSDPIKVTHTKGAMSDGQKYTNTLPWKVELTNDDLAYQEDIQNLQRQINALEADLTWRDPVETYEELPASGNDDGDVRLVTSTGVLYVWAGSEWVALNETHNYAAGDGIDITNDVISATNTGKARELTSADYNWPVANPNGVALWLLDSGVYYRQNGVKFYRASGNALGTAAGAFVVSKGDTNTTILSVGSREVYVANTTSGTSVSAVGLLDSSNVTNNLTSTSTTNALSANQGKVLNERIGDLTTLTTTDKTSAVAAINEIAANIPTVVSDLTNDAGYQTAADVAAAIAAEEVPSSADWNAIFTAPVANVNGVGL